MMDYFGQELIDMGYKINKEERAKMLKTIPRNSIIGFLIGLNPIKNLTRKEVRKAVKYYQNKITKDNLDYYSWGDGDSIDRERVRDIILKLRSQK